MKDKQTDRRKERKKLKDRQTSAHLSLYYCCIHLDSFFRNVSLCLDQAIVVVQQAYSETSSGANNIVTVGKWLHQSLCQYLHRWQTASSITGSHCVFVSLPVYSFISHSVSLSVSVSACLPLSLISLSLSLCLSLSVCPSLSLSVCLSVSFEKKEESLKQEWPL